eukprot:8990315-Ditylum_brightwellii.AAC.1
MDSEGIATEEVDKMNYCRLFLNAKMMSHLTTSDVQVPPFPYPKDSWPHQQRPYLHTWKKWQQALIKTVCNSEGVLHTLLAICPTYLPPQT